MALGPLAATVMAVGAQPIVVTAMATAMATATREATALATAAVMTVAMAMRERGQAMAQAHESWRERRKGRWRRWRCGRDEWEPIAGMAVAVPKAMHETSAMDVAMDVAMGAAMDEAMVTDKLAGMASKVVARVPRVHLARGEGKRELPGTKGKLRQRRGQTWMWWCGQATAHARASWRGRRRER